MDLANPGRGLSTVFIHKEVIGSWLHVLANLYILLGNCHGNGMKSELLRLACEARGDLVAELQRAPARMPTANTQAFQVA